MEDIDKIERIQRSFTDKIKGMKKMDYHERLKTLNTYSLERRRGCFLIKNAWQQIEGKNENILDLETGKVERQRYLR